MKELPPHNADIARGIFPHIPLQTVLRYREMLRKRGFVLPELERSDEEVESVPETPQDSGMQGLGDLIHKGLEMVGIKQKKGCGCEKRQRALNRLFPFKKRGNAVLPPDDRRQEN